MNIFWFLALLLWQVLWGRSKADLPPCKVLGPCSCKVDGFDGKIISLQDIDSKLSPKYVMSDKFTGSKKYHYSPCTPFDYKDYKQILVYQTTNTDSYYNLGEPLLSTAVSSQYQFIYKGNNLDGQVRTTIITLMCNEAYTTADVSPVIEFPLLTYTFTVTSNCACPGHCSYDPNYSKRKPHFPKKGHYHHISTGSALCIVLFSFVLVYAIGGCIVNKYVRQKEGSDIVPNKEFWRELPSLVRDGCGYSFQKINGLRTTRGQYEQIG